MNASSADADRSPIERVAVLIPTYNEAENLEWIVARVHAANPQVDVVVLDDASPDGTGEIADRLAAADARVHVLHREGKEGLGAAYLHGFRWALEQGYDAVVEMDADGSHQPEQLHRLLDALSDADLVLGSRWIPGGAIENWPLHRKAISVGGNIYIRAMLGMPVGDATGGYRVYRSSALRQIGLEGVESTGYCFQTDMVWRFTRAGLVVREVPITFVERVRGNSKMSPDIARETFRRVTQWGLTHRTAQARDLADRVRARRGGPRWHSDGRQD